MQSAGIVGAHADLATPSYVEWGPIFAGAVLAVSISLVLFAFAGGVGLAVASPWPGADAGATLSVLSVAWILLTMLLSSICGGYIAGRLRSPRAGASVMEMEFRDGAHGLLVWATGLILATLAAMALSLAAGAAASDADAWPDDYDTNVLLRGAGDDYEALRREINPVVVRIAAGDDLSAEDRAYLADVIAENSGVSEGEASARVDNWAAAKIEEADDARRAGAIAAFLLAATSLTAGAAAYFAAGMGGRHRDRNLPFPWTRVRLA